MLYDFFIIYTTFNDDLEVAQTIYRRMRGWYGIMSWKVCGRKRSWPNLRYYPGICLKGLRKQRETPRSRSTGRDLSPGPP